MPEQASILSHTESLCPHCLQKLPANRVLDGETVFLEKTCPEHGTFRTKIWQGNPSFESWVRPKIPGTMANPFTEETLGCPFDCGLCSSHRQQTCTAVIEVTNRCNLNCTFCFADAGGASEDPDLRQIEYWYQRLMDSGGPCNIQISGGEPTLRDDLPDIIALGHEVGFRFIQLNTNGIQLSRNSQYLEALKRAGLSSVFLQFDGTEPEIYQKLRGVNLLEQKLETIRRCGELGIGVVLVPTVVAGVNDHNLGATIELALQHLPYVRGVHFQPASYFGRVPQAPSDEMRITMSEVMSRVEEQTQGKMKIENFRPPGCENELCSFHGNFILTEDGTLLPTTRHQASVTCCGPVEHADEGARKAKKFVASHWSMTELSVGQTGPTWQKESFEPTGCGCVTRSNQSTACCSSSSQAEETANRCGCESGLSTGHDGWFSKSATNVESLDMFLERAETHTLTVSGMAFQDAWNVDLERLKDCCIHTVAAADGKLVPFCAYNLTDSSGKYLYRGRKAEQMVGGRAVR